MRNRKLVARRASLLVLLVLCSYIGFSYWSLLVFEVITPKVDVKFHGSKVVRYGIFRFSRKSFTSGREWDGDSFDGPCFVDIYGLDGGIRRFTGFHMSRLIHRETAARELRIH